VEYNGIVNVTGAPKLEVRNSEGTLLSSYSYADFDKSSGHFVDGQTLLFNGGQDLTNKILSINLNGGTIKSKSNTTNYLEEVIIVAGTNAQLNPPTDRGRGRGTIKGTDGHDLILGQQGIDTLTGSSGRDTFQIPGRDALINDANANDLKFERITDFIIGTDNLVGRFSVNPAMGVISTNWQQMQIFSSPLSSLTVGAIERLLNQTNFKAQGASAFTFGSDSTKRTFIALNDETAGFQKASDDIVEITGYSGDLRDLAIWKVL
jgi:Ca2+-binding RTX toxin-like protein